MGERGVRNAEVRGSIPLISTYPQIVINHFLVSEISAFYIPKRYGIKEANLSAPKNNTFGVVKSSLKTEKNFVTIIT